MGGVVVLDSSSVFRSVVSGLLGVERMLMF